MKKLVLVAAMALMSTAALAQGGGPYNGTATNAGGPLAGRQRAMGASGGEPATFGNGPMAHHRMMRHHRMHHPVRHYRRHHGSHHG